jgi:hypothetical protein
MPTLAELKASSPAYAQMSDMDFASKVYRKHYADKMSFPDFAKKAAFDPYGDAKGVDPTEGMSGFDKFRAGFGKAGMDTVEGVKQLLGATSQAEVDARAKRDAPLMASGAGMAGNIGGQIDQMLVPVGGEAKAASLLGKAAPYVASAARAASFQAAQPMVTGQDRSTEAGKAGLFGAGGALLNKAGAEAGKGVISRMEPMARDLAQGASDLGMKLGLGQLSDNPLVRTVASQMERLPFSGATSRAKANQAVLNQRVGETFGANDTKITPDVFAAAKAKLSHGFEVLTGRNNLALDSKSVSKINGVMDEAERLSGSGKIVKGWVNELLSKADEAGNIPGKSYQSFDSRLGKIIKQGGEPAHYLGQLRDAVRGAMDSSISAGDRKAWQVLRSQWAHMKTVEPLVAKSATGDISAAGLMGRVTADKAGKSRMATGNGGQLGTLAKIGQRFLKDAPNSGTADRLLVNGAVAGGLYEGQKQGYISPEHAAEVGAFLIANRGLLGLLNSRALATGEGKAISGLARLLKPAPKYLPATAGGLLGHPVPEDKKKP